MLSASLVRTLTYKMFKLLPTEAKRQMDTFHTQWEILNTDIILSVRQVGDRLCPFDKDCSSRGVLMKPLAQHLLSNRADFQGR